MIQFGGAHGVRIEGLPFGSQGDHLLSVQDLIQSPQTDVLTLGNRLQEIPFPPSPS